MKTIGQIKRQVVEGKLRSNKRLLRVTERVYGPDLIGCPPLLKLHIEAIRAAIPKDSQETDRGNYGV